MVELKSDFYIHWTLSCFKMKKNPILIISLVIIVFGCNSTGNLRKIISLDGDWNIAESFKDNLPAKINADAKNYLRNLIPLKRT
jgi:hypothetical protein